MAVLSFLGSLLLTSANPFAMYFETVPNSALILEVVSHVWHLHSPFSVTSTGPSVVWKIGQNIRPFSGLVALLP